MVRTITRTEVLRLEDDAAHALSRALTAYQRLAELLVHYDERADFDDMTSRVADLADEFVAVSARAHDHNTSDLDEVADDLQRIAASVRALVRRSFAFYGYVTMAGTAAARDSAREALEGLRTVADVFDDLAARLAALTVRSGAGRHPPPVVDLPCDLSMAHHPMQRHAPPRRPAPAHLAAA